MERQHALQGFDFCNAPQLQKFVLRNIRPTGRWIGEGSYGTVEVLDMQGLICAGKKLLMEENNMGDGTASILRRFVDECSLLSCLRHPNIVQFLGICFLQTSDTPVLVMEFLPHCLDNLLDPEEGTERVEIPLGMKYDILSDTAHGLVHLHTQTPSIIHRDLTAKNILLTSAMMGKIADLGVARILNLQPGDMTASMTMAPGTWAYMPPEVFTKNPVYNTSIDMFSFGHLILYAIIQDFPYPTEPTLPDPHNPVTILAITEVQRRSQQMQELSHMLGGEGHPLVQVVMQCLHNDPRQRPSARQVLDLLQQMRAQIDDPYGNMSKLELIQALGKTKARGREAVLQAQIIQLQGQLQAKEVALETSQQVQAQFRAQTQQYRSRLKASQAETQHVQGQLRAKETEVQWYQSRMQHVEAQWQADAQKVEQELRIKEQENQELRAQLRRRDAEAARPMAPTHHAQARQTLRSFEWKRGKNLLFGTSVAHAVVLNGKVYVGGGLADKDEDQYTIQVYTAETNGWSRLPRSPVKWFALAVVNQQLVLVGGYDAGQRRTSVLVWDSSFLDWTTPYPDFPMARRSPVAVGYQQYLVIAGRQTGSSVDMTPVDVFDSMTRRWSSAAPLPVGCREMTAAVVGDILHLLGGFNGRTTPNKRMFSISLPALVTHATSTSRATPPSWQVTDTEFTESTAVYFYSSLLAVGGKDASGTRSSEIRLYNPQTRQWSKVGDVPAAVERCSCTVLRSGELVVIGGRDSKGHSDKMYITTVN